MTKMQMTDSLKPCSPPAPRAQDLMHTETEIKIRIGEKQNGTIARKLAPERDSLAHCFTPGKRLCYRFLRHCLGGGPGIWTPQRHIRLGLEAGDAPRHHPDARTVPPCHQCLSARTGLRLCPRISYP